MSQRPFISTNQNIFDENRCVFSPSLINGQAVMISHGQNRKICDTSTTAIASNQMNCNNCCCGSYQAQAQPNVIQQPWSCGLQAQKQGVPGGVLFNFPPSNNSCPPTCPPPAYTPPPLPAPQMVDCPNRTPQTICVDFGRYGLEAMAFQQKCRENAGFTYDKQVGTCDFIPLKGNTCCCGTQATSLISEEKQDLFHRIDQSDSQYKLKVCPQGNQEDKKKCTCFPKPRQDLYGCVKTLVIGERKEMTCKEYDIVDQATREADAEEYLCCDCLEKWRAKNSCKKPSCLKNPQRKVKDADTKPAVSFSLCNNSLVITEDTGTTSESMDVKGEENSDGKYQKLTEGSCCEITERKMSEEDLKEREKCENIKEINRLKQKKRNVAQMAALFIDTLLMILRKFDVDISEMRKSCGVENTKSNTEQFIRLCKMKLVEAIQKHDECCAREDVEGASTSSEAKSGKEKRRERQEMSPCEGFISKSIEQLEKYRSKKKDKGRNTVTGKSETPLGKLEQNIIEDQKIDLEKPSTSKQSDNAKNEVSREPGAPPEELENIEENSAQKIIVTEKPFTLRLSYPDESLDSGRSVGEQVKNQPSTSKEKHIGSEFSPELKLDQSVPKTERIEEKTQQSLRDEEEEQSMSSNQRVMFFTTNVSGFKHPNKFEGPTSGSKRAYVVHNLEDYSHEVKIVEEDKEQLYENQDIELEQSQVPVSESEGIQVHPDKDKSERKPVQKFTKEEPCKCCTCNNAETVSSESETSTDDFGNFQPCLCGRSTISRLGNYISSVCSASVGRIGDLMQLVMGNRTSCLPTTVYNNCDDSCDLRRIARYGTSLDECSRRICPSRLHTNRFCGRTCYDVDRNVWYSCCPSQNYEQKVVQITFRETAARRYVRLDTTCRNCRYNVIYE